MLSNADEVDGPDESGEGIADESVGRKEKAQAAHISLGGIKFPRIEKPALAQIGPSSSESSKEKSEGSDVKKKQNHVSAKEVSKVITGHEATARSSTMSSSLPKSSLDTPTKSRRDRSSAGNKELQCLIDDKFYCQKCGKDFYHMYSKKMHELNCKFVAQGPPILWGRPEEKAARKKVPPTTSTATTSSPVGTPTTERKQKYPRNCSRCGLVFRFAKKFRSHVSVCRRIQPGVMYKCDHCAKEFKDKGGRTFHMNKFHASPTEPKSADKKPEQKAEKPKVNSGPIAEKDQPPTHIGPRRPKFALPNGAAPGDANHELECEVCHRVFSSIYSRQRHEGAVHSILTPRGGSNEEVATTTTSASESAAPRSAKLKQKVVQQNSNESLQDSVGNENEDQNKSRTRTYHPTKCPVCKKTLSNVGNAMRHLKNVHKKIVTKEELKGLASKKTSYESYKATANKLKVKLASSKKKVPPSPVKSRPAPPVKVYPGKVKITEASPNSSEDDKPPILERQARLKRESGKTSKKKHKTEKVKPPVLTTCDVICACCDKVFTAKCDFSQYRERKKTRTARLKLTTCLICDHKFTHEDDFTLHLQFRHRDLLAGMEERNTTGIRDEPERKPKPKPLSKQESVSAPSTSSAFQKDTPHEDSSAAGVTIVKDETASLEDAGLALTAAAAATFSQTQTLQSNKVCPVCGIFTEKLGPHLMTHVNKSIPCACTPCGLSFSDISKLLKHNLENHQGRQQPTTLAPPSTKQVPVPTTQPPRVRILSAENKPKKGVVKDPPPPVLEKCVKSSPPPRLPVISKPPTKAKIVTSSSKVVPSTRVASVTPALLSLLSKRQPPTTNGSGASSGKSQLSQIQPPQDKHPQVAPAETLKRRMDTAQETIVHPPIKKVNTSNSVSVGNKDKPSTIPPPAPDPDLVDVSEESEDEVMMPLPPFPCQYCSVGFSKNHDLIAHVTQEHSGGEGEEAEMTFEEIGVIGGISVKASSKVEIEKILLSHKYSGAVDPLTTENCTKNKRKHTQVEREVEESEMTLEEVEMDLD